MKIQLRIAQRIKGILAETEFRNSGQAQLYLMGQNRNGVVDTLIDMVILRDGEGDLRMGCAYTPGYDREEMSRALLSLIKNRREFAGFLRISPFQYAYEWGRSTDCGDTPKDFPGVLFITYYNFDKISTARYYPEDDQTDFCICEDGCTCEEGIGYNETKIEVV